MSFKFDWRFFTWGIRNNAGDIPVKTQWALDLAADLSMHTSDDAASYLVWTADVTSVVIDRKDYF